jgi:DNA-binding IclR family transcriptional regulator
MSSEEREPIAARVFKILEAIVDAEAPVGPRPLSRALNIERSAVSRILKALVGVGALTRTEGGYVLGTRMYALARSVVAGDTLSQAAGPILQEVTAQFDESSYIFARHDDAGSMIFGVESTQPVRYVIELGSPNALYAGAAGRAILSALPDDEVLEVLERSDLKAYTPTTTTDRDQLMELVREARRLGYAVAFEEVVPGGWGVASPFFDHQGVCIGSVVLTGPMSRLSRRMIPQYGRGVRDAARLLSERLGLRRDR